MDQPTKGMKLVRLGGKVCDYGTTTTKRPWARRTATRSESKDSEREIKGREDKAVYSRTLPLVSDKT